MRTASISAVWLELVPAIVLAVACALDVYGEPLLPREVALFLVPTLRCTKLASTVLLTRLWSAHAAAFVLLLAPCGAALRPLDVRQLTLSTATCMCRAPNVHMIAEKTSFEQQQQQKASEQSQPRMVMSRWRVSV